MDAYLFIIIVGAYLKVQQVNIINKVCMCVCGVPVLGGGGGGGVKQVYITESCPIIVACLPGGGGGGVSGVKLNY